MNTFPITDLIQRADHGRVAGRPNSHADGAGPPFDDVFDVAMEGFEHGRSTMSDRRDDGIGSRERSEHAAERNDTDERTHLRSGSERPANDARADEATGRGERDGVGEADTHEGATSTSDGEHDGDDTADHERPQNRPPGGSVRPDAPAADRAAATAIEATGATPARALGLHPTDADGVSGPTGDTTSAPGPAPATGQTPTTGSATTSPTPASAGAATSGPTTAASTPPAETGSTTGPADGAGPASVNTAESTVASATTTATPVADSPSATGATQPSGSATPNATPVDAAGQTATTTPAAASTGQEGAAHAEETPTPGATAPTPSTSEQSPDPAGPADPSTIVEGADAVEMSPLRDTASPAPRSSQSGGQNSVNVAQSGSATGGRGPAAARPAGQATSTPPAPAWAAPTDDARELLAKADLNRLTSNGTRLGVDLSTNQLGSVRVEAVQRAGQLHVDLLSEIAATRSVLADHADELRNDLRANGLDLDSVDVRTGDENARSRSNGNGAGRSDERSDHAPDRSERGRSSDHRATVETTHGEPARVTRPALSDDGVDVRI